MDAEPITPNMQAILDALGESGPATDDDLRKRVRIRRRSTFEDAASALATAGHITRLASDIDGGQPRWRLIDLSSAADPGTEAGAEDRSPAQESADPSDPFTVAGQGTNPEPETQNDDSGGTTNGEPEAEPSPTEDNITPDVEPPPPSVQDDDSTQGEEQAAETKVKACRGCTKPMPVVCPECGRSTGVYCATCRATRATARPARSAAEPQILANGLPKLRRGELEEQILGVLRSHPLPTFAGQIGWTTQRVAVHVPGRSQGAIGGALSKLADIGKLELLGEKPMRYQLTTTEASPAAPAQDSDIAQPAGDAAPDTDVTPPPFPDHPVTPGEDTGPIDLLAHGEGDAPGDELASSEDNTTGDELAHSEDHASPDQQPEP
jgi:hypothetical protein